MTRARHCGCPRTRRDWLADGTCGRCKLTVGETQILDAIRSVLISDPACLLWRNEIGHNTHWPDGKQREHPIKYGICNPGGADLIGLYGGRFLAVEVKTPIGTVSEDQQNFGRWIAMRGGVFAVLRSVTQAAELLAWLQGGCLSPQPKDTTA